MESNNELTMHRETLSIEGPRNLYSYTFSRGEDPFDRLMRLAGGGDVNALRGFLDQFTNVPLERPDRPATPLHVAARNGHTPSVQELLARGCALERRDSDDGLTPLGCAIKFGRPDVVRTLLDAGAQVEQNDVNNARRGVNGEFSAISNASPEDYQRVMEMLEGR